MNEELVEAIKSGGLAEWQAIHPWEHLYLHEADLKGVDLNGAYLSRANLNSTDLSGANLSGANLTGAFLQGSNLTMADLSGADLSGANFRRADLSNARLNGSNLTTANLSATILSGADLSGAHLFDADMSGANLTRVNLTNANVVLANLLGADLRGANLSNANLGATILIRAFLNGATLTGAGLYGSARNDWNIEGVICDYVFWDVLRAERRHKDRDLEPGEFERLYSQIPTIEYVFEDGLHPLDHVIMDRIVQAINEKNPEFELQIDSLNTRGIYPTITFNVKFEEQKTTALATISQEFDTAKARRQGHDEILTAISSLAGLQSGQSINVTGDYNVIATDGSTISIQEAAGHLVEIQKAIEDAPAGTIAEDARREALEAVSQGFKDIALGKVKEAAKGVTERILRLGIDIATKTRGYESLADLVD